MENLWLIAVALLSYLTGSFSTAQAVSRKSLSEWGNDSWGTMSTIQKTGSKWKGLVVLIGDALKGFLPVFTFMGFAPFVGYNEVLALFVSGTGVILGHNYSINLGFRGGRGLATGLGVMFAVNWVLALVCFATLTFSVFAFELWIQGGFRGSFLKLARGNLLGRVVGIVICLVPIYFLAGLWQFLAILPMIFLVIYSHRKRVSVYISENKAILKKRLAFQR